MAQPNMYLEQHMKNSTPYVELAQEITSKLNAKIKNGKHLLTLLRELSVYSGPNQGHNDGLARALLSAIKDTSALDIDKKIVRTSYFLLSDMVSNTCNAGAMSKISTELIQHLLFEIKQATGSRLCMAWRLLARIVFACQSEDLVEATLITTIKTLKYPEKEKKFLGQKKANEEFENRLHFWTALFSSLRRIRRCPPPHSIHVILTGCRSPHIQLARHSFYLLKSSLESHSYEIGEYFISSLKDWRHCSDVMSCVYLMEACKAFIISTEADKDANITTKRPIEETLKFLFKMLEDNRLKIRVECIRVLTEIPQGDSFRAALASIGGPELVSRLVNSILPHLSKLFVPVTEEAGNEAAAANQSLPAGQQEATIPIGFGEISLFPLCRASIRIGRYMTLRPINDHLDESSAAEEETRLENLVRPLGTRLAQLCREFLQSRVYLPHARSEVLKALLWIMPDNRGRVSLHCGLWDWLREQMIVATPAIGEDLAEHLVNHVFGRVTASPFYSEELLGMALACAEEAVRCFVTDGGNAAGVLIQVWQKLYEYGEHRHARETILRSLIGAADGTLWHSAPLSRSKYSKDLHTSHCSLPHVSHHQGLLSLRHFALWALGEYVCLWDYDKEFKSSDIPAAAVDPTLRTVLYQFPISFTHCSTSQTGCHLPPLIQVVGVLLQAIQMETSLNASVCMESLFKISLWCDSPENPLRELIRRELYEVSASAYGLNYPTADMTSPFEDPLIRPFDLYSSSEIADPRSPLAGLDRMGLGHVVDTPSTSHRIDTSACHYNARKFGYEWQGSGICREAGLYSLAIESLAVAKHPPKLCMGHQESPKSSMTNNSLLGSGDVFGDIGSQQSTDLLIGDVLDEPILFSEPEGEANHTVFNFVVDGSELKRLLYLLNRRVIAS